MDVLAYVPLGQRVESTQLEELLSKKSVELSEQERHVEMVVLQVRQG